MTYYLGKPGALIALPDPEAGLPMTPERIGGTHQLLSGKRVRDTLGRMRTWQLSWTAIDLTTFGTLNGFFLGAFGPGPYYFFDPEQRNLLTPNQSSGTDVTGDTTDLGTFGSGATVTSATNASLTGLRSLKVQWTGTISAGAAGAATTLTAIRPSTAYTASIAVGFGTVGFVSCVLAWYDSTGTFISAAAGTSVDASGGWGVVATSTATSPSGAYYCSVRLANTAGNTGTTVASTDNWQLEQAASASAWVPGAGVPLVTVENLSRSTPLAGVCDAQMTLLQVA